MEADMVLNKRQVRKFNPAVLFATARNRTEFEDKIIDFQPDIVLSDYNLPDMNGLEALLYVREHLDSTPFVFVTGMLNDEERVAETILNGASGYLLKDNLDKLPELLETIVTQSETVLRQREMAWERKRESQLLLQKTIQALRHSALPEADEWIRQLDKVAHHISFDR